MKLLVILLGLSVVIFFGLFVGGCTDQTRYFCQQLENLENPECQPPLCRISDRCASDLIGTVVP
jgi:hypothetical protein